MTFTQKEYKKGDVIFIVRGKEIRKAKIYSKNNDKRLPRGYIVLDNNKSFHYTSSDMVYSRLSSAKRAIMKSIVLIDMTKKDVSK